MQILNLLSKQEFNSAYTTRHEIHFILRFPCNDKDYIIQQHIFATIIDNFTHKVYERELLCNLYRELYTKCFNQLFTSIDMVVFNLVFLTNIEGDYMIQVEHQNYFNYSDPYGMILEENKSFAPLEFSLGKHN